MNNLKEFEFKICFIYIIGYAIFYIPSMVLDYSISIEFWISELDRKVFFTFGLDDFCDIFLSGILFSLLLWKIFESIFSAHTEEEFKSINLKHVLSPKNIEIIKYIFIFLLIFYNIGNSVHEVANHLNSVAFEYSNDFSNPQYAELYYQIYWWDEFFGHMSMAVPLYSFLIIYLVGFNSLRMKEIVNTSKGDFRGINTSKKNEKNNFKKGFIIKLKWIFITLSGIGFGIEWFYGWAEGQALFVTSLINIGIIIYNIYNILHKSRAKSDSDSKFYTKYKLKDHPFSVFLLIEATIFIIATILWGIFEGIKPYYPFFYQPDEKLWMRLL
ncbi:MAG: hypothetical protein ACTSRZ_03590 [Promethearchaeota archaeon]